MLRLRDVMIRTYPKRIQRLRKKGWTMPADTIYVGRPSRWGNPFTKYRVIQWDLGDYQDDRLAIWRDEAVHLFSAWIIDALPDHYYDPHPIVPEWVAPRERPDLRPLRGKNLACWCRLDQPCHADVLLELANE